MKSLGFVDNVTLFPHGIIDHDAPTRPNGNSLDSSRRKPFIIGSYGFFLPHKGIPELIEATAILRKAGIDVRLKLVNAEFPEPLSAEAIRKAKAKIAKLKLGRYVDVITDFLTEEEYLDILESLPKENQYLDDDHPDKFIADMGADALYALLSRLDLDSLSYDLRHKASTETSQQRKNEALKRLQVVEAFRASKGVWVEITIKTTIC